MPTNDLLLPSYRNPPVTEVVIGASFKPIADLTGPAIVDIWSNSPLSKRFPKAEEQPPYAPPIERFDLQPQMAAFSLQLIESITPRLVFMTKDSKELVQIQRDYFACNWRKVGPADKYGRWPSRRAAFTKWFGTLSRAVSERKLGDLVLQHGEVTYVNHLVAGEGWDRHGELPRLLRLAGAPPRHGFLPEPELVRASASYQIPGPDGAPVGRLHVDAQPGFRTEDKKPIIVLTLTARGNPITPGLDGLMAFLDLGRVWIVRAFAELTAERMAKIWGLNE